MSSGIICNIDIVPDNAIDNTTSLLVHRNGDHYNGIIPMPSVNPFPEKAASVCPDSCGDDLHICQDKNTPKMLPTSARARWITTRMKLSEQHRPRACHTLEMSCLTLSLVN